MNFRSYNHFLEFPIIVRRFVPGMIDTWCTRRVPGRVFRGDSRGCRAVSEWSLGLGHAAQPEASGEISLGTRVRSAFGASGRIFPKVHSGTLVASGKHSEDGRGVYRIGSRRELRDAWRLGGLPEVVYCLGTRGQMASSGGFRRKGFRSALGNTWRVPRVDPEGLSRWLRRACGVAFGLPFGTHGMFRSKDRRRLPGRLLA